jgi:hypothetical protein
MSEPLQVRVSRDGKEIGVYPVSEISRLVSENTLWITDHYWHEGMTEWAPLTRLLAEEAQRKLKEKQNEEAERLRIANEKIREEQAKAKQEEDRVVAEAVRIRMEKEKAKFFNCSCCRGTFKEPKDPARDFSTGIWGLAGAALLMFIPVIGPILGAILAIYSTCIILASHLVSPYCPFCRSANFSRPEKSDDQK